jgi:hypothetical protein
MAWNLLLDKHERRTGYAWIELGRIGVDGAARYLTLGAGLMAVATRCPVDHWFFTMEQQRMGRESWLINPQRVVLGKEHLVQAQAETSDFGMIVTIIYQNRSQRPDLIEASILDEIIQRRELLTARETEVLENHLQAEVAAAIQRMLREAEARLQAINGELAKGPASIGVKFRLVWQILPEGFDGAPVGPEAARKRLLQTSFDAWSREDRKIVGTMLQNRIAAERTRAGGEGGSLLDLLGRALDYRRWQRFRFQRWQDGQWRPLSGPPSSGERALGLTVPLFAAVSSFYTLRRIEACAAFGAARRSLRRYRRRARALYGTDPRIRSRLCHDQRTLQRREGIDVVYVSRWTWDGKARHSEVDGINRVPPAAAGGSE